ncbi:unnamed protein product [Mytilus coruscus]|uniref:B box-type domain-containing protein n=1 Tax=Mytilus coruscus TaxID=42192 RepID=A0A6J8B0D3_MYTCO|nr:unnamed protein product [Mytilus coruscus]
MACNWAVCGVCDCRNTNKQSIVWCPKCDKGLCCRCREQHCNSELTKTHNIIPITEYQKLPLNLLESAQTCSIHNEQYEKFCKMHDSPCCRKCVTETHKSCKDLTAIGDIVKNIKSSNAFLEVEQMLAETLENTTIICNDRQENLRCLQEQRTNIAFDVEQTRTMINDHLDKLQENLMNELCVTEEYESHNVKQLLSVIEKNKTGMTYLQNHLSYIKQHASEKETFLVVKCIEKEVSVTKESIQSVLKSKDMKTKNIRMVFNKEVQNIGGIRSFGSVCVESNPSQVAIVGIKKLQAQKMAPIKISKCIDDIVLSNKKQIHLHGGRIRGCLILPNGKMMFCFYDDHKIVALDSNGTHDFEIKLNTTAYDMTFIEAENTIAVTSGPMEQFIFTVDLNSKQLTRSIKVGSYLYGIALRKDVLVYCEEERGITEMKLNEGSEKVVVSLDKPTLSYIAVHNERFYFTNKENHSVSCYDRRGNLEWEFKETRNVECPQGVSVDSNGNLYVAGMNSNSIVVISPDGKKCRKLLSASDGLKKPRVLHFEQNTKKLLVANERSCAFLYEVS